MHIVEAFEETLKNKSEVQNDINKLSMELMASQDQEKMKIAEKLQEISSKVGSMLTPLTGK